MNELIPVEYKKERILSTQQIAEAYETDSRRISENFNLNKERYIVGKHYYELSGQQKREFLNHTQIELGSKRAYKLYLWTERGALLHAKSLNTDKAWQMYDYLVDHYFRTTDVIRFTANLTEKVDALEAKLENIARFATITELANLPNESIYVKELMEEPIWKTSTAEQKAVLLTIMNLANHNGKTWFWQGEQFSVQPGQFITSSNNLAAAAGVSKQNVRTALLRFRKYGFSTYESAKNGILVNVTNWKDYQGIGVNGSHLPNQDPTKSQPLTRM